MRKPIPKYVRHKARNCGKVTIHRKTHYLPGEFNSEESKTAYGRLLAEYLTGQAPLTPTAFDELLELLPSDPQGLLGRASAKLHLDEPVIESATTDISAAESAGAEETGLNKVKTLLQQVWSDHLGVAAETTNSIGMKFVVIPSHVYTQNRSASERDHQVPYRCKGGTMSPAEFLVALRQRMIPKRTHGSMERHIAGRVQPWITPG